MKSVVPGRDGPQRAFTRLDLCALTAVLGLLGTVLLPALAAGGRGAGSLVCLDNLRRLTAAWVLYAEENQGRLVFNPASGMAANPSPAEPRLTWATGWLDWGSSAHNTNTAFLTDPRYGGLSAYFQGDPSLFRCPEDRHLSPLQQSRGWAWRARSYSMNYFTGGIDPQYAGTTFQLFNRISDFKQIAPGQVYLFLEEQPDSMDDPCLHHLPSRVSWLDVPGAFHAGSSWVSFADGHVERRVWSSPVVLAKVSFRGGPSGPASGDPDYSWLAERATQLR